jgi:intracellular multiplication protein IcmE
VIAALRRNPNHCDIAELKAAHALGVSASTIKQTLGCSAQALLAAGYTPAELRDAGFTAAELKDAGLSAAQLKTAGFSAKELANAGFSAADLKAAGFDAEQLKDAGFSASDLKQAGFSVAQLEKAGYSPKELKNAGFSAKELIAAGLTPTQLKDAGFSASDLKKLGLSDQALQDAGFSSQSSEVAGLASLDPSISTGSNLTNMPGHGGHNVVVNAAKDAQAQQLQEMMARQKAQMADQKFQQKVQQRTSAMLSAANADLQVWKQVSKQTYASSPESGKMSHDQGADITKDSSYGGRQASSSDKKGSSDDLDIKTGDILFAVIDTSVNSDEPSPILATIVSGALKGSKLIGSFNLPSHSDKMVISFTTLSVPGQSKTVSINAYAIDPETGRTALSSETNHHYLQRYGSLFASTFIEGFGNAFQSADTTITIGGTGGTTDTTVQNGIGRSLMENAVIGLATVGKAWGQYAQQGMSRPTTVMVYSGTGIGVLFTQSVQK